MSLICFLKLITMIIVNNNNHDLLQLSIFPMDLFLNAHVSVPASFQLLAFLH